tara:strand:- start:243 stop:662 length:420 start_codon:yes stop_codon:yes gene_type:complete
MLDLQDANKVRRIRGILGRLQSNHEGERLAAVEALHKTCRSWGGDIFDLVPEPNSLQQAGSSARKPSRGFSSQPERAEILRPHQREAFVLLHSGYDWDDWKRKFLHAIHGNRQSLSQRQQDKLNECRRMANAWQERRAA